MSFTTLDDFLTRASDRLDPISGAPRMAEVGDLDLVEDERAAAIRPAAVLIPVIPRPTGPTALLTQRPDTMASHPGQVAFPGGKVDRADVNEVAAALREAEEEVGVVPETVELIAIIALYK